MLGDVHPLLGYRGGDGRQLPNLVCWSRMQAEAGQGLGDIIARKEVERRAGNGLFFWGVGNAPARMTPVLARVGTEIEAVFSVMLSKPKSGDVRPDLVVAWRKFVDLNGNVREVPDHVLVTSRADLSGQRRRHYALTCRSEHPLALDDLGPFDPTRFRNVGGAGARVGASQVTALLVSSEEEASGDARYRANLRATLVDSFWVKLVDPVLVEASERSAIGSVNATTDTETWLELTGRVRGGSKLMAPPEVQPRLFV